MFNSVRAEIAVSHKKVKVNGISVQFSTVLCILMFNKITYMDNIIIRRQIILPYTLLCM